MASRADRLLSTSSLVRSFFLAQFALRALEGKTHAPTQKPDVIEAGTNQDTKEREREREFEKLWLSVNFKQKKVVQEIDPSEIDQLFGLVMTSCLVGGGQLGAKG